MKRLKKTFFTIILSLLFVLSSFVTAFADDVDNSAFESFAVTVIGDVTSLSDDELDMTIENYRGSFPSFASGLETWKTIKAEMGDFLGLNTCDVTENEDGTYKVTADADFTGSKCIVTIGIGSDGYISSLSFEKPSTMGEVLKNASSNLVVGMGTVFLVLIFLCFIISLFKYINVAEKKMADKKIAKNTTAIKTPVVTEAGNKSVEVTPLSSTCNEDEIQAVIAAAIAAYESDSACRIEKQPVLNNGITVKSYRRK